MALSKDTNIPTESGYGPVLNHAPVTAATKIYKGAAVSQVSGNAKPLAGADSVFLGFATEQADNSNGAAAAIDVEVNALGISKLSVTNVTNSTAVGTPVYATADDTFQLSATSALAIGRVHRVVKAGVAMVKWEASGLRGIDTSEV